MTTDIQTTLPGALASIQGAALTVGKGEQADTGKYSYTYASLADVHAVILPRLADAGLAWTVGTTLDESGRCWATGTLWHVTSGEQVTSHWPMPGTTDPQVLGSALTYARRYLLLAAVGVATGDDDDGAAASSAPNTAHTAPPQHTYQDLVDLCAEAEAAGVTGDFDALLDWVAEHDDPAARVDTAYGRVRRAMTEQGVG